MDAYSGRRNIWFKMKLLPVLIFIIKITARTIFKNKIKNIKAQIGEILGTHSVVVLLHFLIGYETGEN